MSLYRNRSREARDGRICSTRCKYLDWVVYNPVCYWHSFDQPCSWFYFRVNVACGQAEERVLLTGLHAVADIYCECCKTPLGWKYVSYWLQSRIFERLNTNQSNFCSHSQEHAFESSQKYKEGKYIIELAHMIKENGWDWSPSHSDKCVN